MLETLVRTYRDRGGDVFLMRVGARARRLMETTACLDYIRPENILDEDSAIDYLFHRVLDPAICIYECPIRVFRECQNLPKRFDLIDIAQPSGAAVIPTQPTDASDLLITPRELWRTLRLAPPAQRPVVLDVREPREFKRSRIAEAQSLPLSTLLRDGLILSDSRPIVLVCSTGRRSRRAATVLRNLGFSDVSLVEGGMQGWESAGLLTAVEFESNGATG
jgi:SulP family sulfate permease